MLTLRSQSFRRYRIGGRIPSPHSDEFYQAVRDRKFLPLTPSEERTYGWATVDNLLITDFDMESVMRGNWAALGLRVDRRRVNNKLLRAHIDLELIARRKAAEDAGSRFKLGRDERKQIREDLHAELLKQTSPSVDIVPVLMHSKRRVAHVLALGKGVNDLVRVHFLDTFGVELVPLTPWRRSQELLEGAPALERLDDLHRTDFARAPGGTDAASRGVGPLALEDRPRPIVRDTGAPS
ncbi:MAG: hypothetical protein QNJ98_02710 [Planctomycetota bacterium]|nr:hypothetical protein [Planctomycetota bacterium]